MKFYGLLAVGGGATAGAWLRWWFGTALNPVFPTIPLGTLAANLLAGLLIGVVTELLGQYATLPLEFRLFAVTGFLGGLSTFSTFSSEVVTLALRRQYGWALAEISIHVAGSLTFTVSGIFIVRFLMAKEGL